MSRVKVSVIIPFFNSEKFLEETIQSVFSGSLKEFEIILVDDGSQDQSIKIAKRWQSNFPQKIKVLSQQNQGPSVARNTGISHASGIYILPLDSDDRISSSYLKEAVNLLEEDQDLKLVYCKAEKFGNQSGSWNLKSFSLKKLALDNMIFVSGIFRKEDWEKVGGYDPRFRWGWEDWEFWINFLKDGGKVYQLESVGFYYRVRKGSRRKSTNKKEKRITLHLLNQKHPEFFKRYLFGPIRNPRSWSIALNQVSNAWIYLSEKALKAKKKVVPTFR